MAKLDDARYLILQNGFMYAGACGVFKALVPIPWLEIGALTWATKNMCTKIVHNYGYDELPGMDKFIGNSIASATGAKLVSGLLDVVPGFNIGTNAVATFTLQTVSGIIVTAACELLDEKAITVRTIENADVNRIRMVLGTVTEVVGEFARGNYQEAIQIVKEAICALATEEESSSALPVECFVEEEIQQCVLLAAADATQELAENIGILNQQEEEDDLLSYSVADVLDYNEYVKYVYATYIDSLPPDRSKGEVIAAAGKAYLNIYARNCKEGLWNQKKGFDDTLAFYVAGYLKEKATCHTLLDTSKETIAYDLSEYLRHRAA